MVRKITSQLCSCLVLGWDKSSFFPNSWHGAVFWIQFENNVENNTLMP